MNHFFNFLIIFILSTLYIGYTAVAQDKTRGDESATVAEVHQSNRRDIDAHAVQVPENLQIQAFSSGLTYPVDITFDDQGNTYIAEAGGHTYGTKPAQAPSARILRIGPDGTTAVIYDKVVPMKDIKGNSSSKDMPEGLIPPITGVTFHDGKLYIAHRSRYSTYDLRTDEFKTIINGLPSWGEFLNAKPIFKGDSMYFFLSTQGNSGVVEEHWVKLIDMFNKPETHEVPGEDITLTGQNFWVPTSKVNIVKDDSVETGAFAALGEKTKAGQVVKGQEICNGAFFRCNPDGTGIERIAWGLRSSLGYRFSPEGKLVATMNSANPMPPRGLYFDYESVYEIKEGEWYGWPDYYSGIPITDERFGVKKAERHFVLTEETHKKLLKGKAIPDQPIALLPVHSAAQGMVFGREDFGVPEEEILVAEFGAIVPFFKGKAYHPELPPGVPEEQNAPDGAKYNWPGFKIQRVDLSTGEASDYIYNEDHLPASVNKTGGLERPIQLSWDPDGNLYIVDFGVVEFEEAGMTAHPYTGVIWKVSRSEDAQVQNDKN
uniref:Glucose/Sorbosone dehydrogenase domain-containing protein n=1 Tax=Roseihalotalea indica TaxID=2867963 RepID=A0AA49JEW3_9BACT|nr:hypothetical protein K4G66_07720 [Tunicatimonas sp. TK19036]